MCGFLSVYGPIQPLIDRSAVINHSLHTLMILCNVLGLIKIDETRYSIYRHVVHYLLFREESGRVQFRCAFDYVIFPYNVGSISTITVASLAFMVWDVLIHIDVEVRRIILYPMLVLT